MLQLLVDQSGSGTCFACSVLASSHSAENITTYGQKRHSHAGQGLLLVNHLHQATQWQCFAAAAVYGESVSLVPVRTRSQSPAVADGLAEGAEKHQTWTSLSASVAKQHVLMTTCDTTRHVAHVP